ncbi:hypothetical protein EVAR_530_1 [Eumeta japonica]|uniref:Uncharacterized protein n=1 Tax=Eumeta variegata TaxID=151549 RepID=A0A4C1SAP8_EUMVA|nr:hypothetical protein EVAR_530_1 [Eumeta japonica]
MSSCRTAFFRFNVTLATGLCSIRLLIVCVQKFARLLDSMRWSRQRSSPTRQACESLVIPRRSAARRAVNNRRLASITVPITIALDRCRCTDMGQISHSSDILKL